MYSMHVCFSLIRRYVATSCIVFAGLSVNAIAEPSLTDLPLLAASDFNLTEYNEHSVPVVLTATRIEQHHADVPASVTVLDHDFIQQTGAQSLAEVLRHVPGMMVGPDRNNNADSVQYHGGPTALPKNLQVLLNGRSMYRSGIASVSWYEMPVALEDIRRIEVVRGPNASSYGANAYQGIINIMTQHPGDSYGSSVALTQGNNGEQDVYAKQGGRFYDTDYRLTFKKKQTDQFVDDFDDKESQFVDFTTHTLLDNRAEMQSFFTLSESDRGLEITGTLEDLQTNKNRIKETQLDLGMSYTQDLSSDQQIKVKSYISGFEQRQPIAVSGVPLAWLDQDLAALYRLNPTAAKQLAQADTSNLNLTSVEEQSLAMAFINRYGANQALAMTPVSGDIDASIDEYRFDIEAQSTWIVNDNMTWVAGASFRRDIIQSDHYLDGQFDNNTQRLFTSLDWKLSQRTLFHTGLMAEKEDHADIVFAPRLSIVHQFKPAHSVRMVYSESVRSPDVFEQHANWNFMVKNATADGTLHGNTFYQTAQGPGDLDHQKIQSYEIGYYGLNPNLLHTELDVRIFHEALTDVIYQSIRLDGFETEDDYKIDFTGIEMQAGLSPWHNGRIRMVAAYVDADTNVTDNERESTLLRIHARNQFNVSFTQSFDNTTASLHYISNRSYDQMRYDTSKRTEFERLDGRIATTMPLGVVDVQLVLNIQHDLSNQGYVWPESVYEDDTRVLGTMRVNW